MYFSEKNIKKLKAEHSELDKSYENIMLQIIQIKLTQKDANEYLYHGLSRRIGILKRCIDNIYEICPPERTEKLSTNERQDLSINLQTFISNIFGCLDNIARIWKIEKKIKDEEGKPLPNPKIGLMSAKNHKAIRQSLSNEFIDYINTINPWYENLENFRHALGHRIPLYVPPYIMTADECKEHDSLEEQKKTALKKQNFHEYEQLTTQQELLGTFVPVIKHSFSENSPEIVFHSQVLADWNTIMEIIEKFIEELK